MNNILHGDCLEKLKELESNSIDCMVTDPPYGYSFMGKDWDKAVPSVDTWKECLRVLKPGSFAFIMSAPRQDVLSQMINRIGEAGFKTDYTSLYWTYASGFPKAMNIGKMVDKRSGRVEFPKNVPIGENTSMSGANYTRHASPPRTTDEAKALDGSYGGFQPKPAVEVVIVAMKPLSEKTYVDQALKNGKGITWLDDGKIPGEKPGVVNSSFESWRRTEGRVDLQNPEQTYRTDNGRFPANLLVSDETLKENSKYFSLDAWADTLPFLHVAKAAKSEKNKGLETFENGRETDGCIRANAETARK